MTDRTAARIESWTPWLVAGAAALVYLNTVPAEFVYDDFPFIVHNPAIHTLARPWKFLTDRSAMSEGGFYTIFRPLSSWIWSVAWHFAGARPSVFHAINVIMHAIASVYVWRFAKEVGLRAATGALWAALIFAVHPVQTEAVAWIAGLGNPLHAIGVTAACIAYLRWRQADGGTGHLAWGAAWYAFALLGKEHAVALPLLLLALEWALRDGAFRPRIQRFGAIAVTFAVVIAYVGWRSHVLGRTAQTGYWGGSLYTTALTMVNAFREYLRLLWWPSNLHPEYIVPVALSPRAPGVVPSAALLAGVVAFAGLMRKRAPLIALGIVWFFCALAPVSNVIPLKAIMNERLLYLAMIGFGLCLGTVLQVVLAHRPAVWARVLSVALFTQLLLFGGLAIRRNMDWRNSERLWTAAVASEPRGYTSQYNLGTVYARQGRYDDALTHLRLAVELRGTFPQAHGAIGNIYMQRGAYAKAIAAYREGLKEAPDNGALRANLVTALRAHGEALQAEGKSSAAQGAFDDAQRIAAEAAP